MPLIKSPSKEAWKSNLKAELDAGKPKEQALAIAFDVQRRSRRADGGALPRIGTVDPAIDRALRVAHRADGGFAAYPQSPAQMRRTAGANPYGFALGTGGGRTDKNNVDVASGSYVLPADVIAGLGEGNSLNGAAVWDQYLNSMPWGIKAPRLSGKRGPPSPPAGIDPSSGVTGSRSRQQPAFGYGLADGGFPLDEGGEMLHDEGLEEAAPEVPIQAADGEIILAPEDVLRVGQFYAPDRLRESGDIDALIKYGHQLLDEFVKTQRGRHIAHLESLRGPVGSKNASVGHTKVTE